MANKVPIILNKPMPESAPLLGGVVGTKDLMPNDTYGALADPTENGDIIYICRIRKDAADRLKKRAGPMPIARYIHENVVARAIEGHVF